MERICQQHQLLCEDNRLIRVPFLIKGKLILPPDMEQDEIEAAFSGVTSDTSYLKLPHAQLIREPVIDRTMMRYTSEFLYEVMPPVQPMELIETDIFKLVRGPYALSVDEIIGFLIQVNETLQQSWGTVERVRRLCGLTMEHPDAYLDGAFAALHSGFDPQAARDMIDNELGVWKIPGSQFLNGWVEVPGKPIPGLVQLLARTLPNSEKISDQQPVTTCIHAMPTRQLHITAGNAPEVPLISTLRLILSKSAGVIKLPFGSTLTGAMLALAVMAAAPEHPLTQNLSIVYWQGGDESMESVLFTTGAFDRIVIWGAPEAITSVQSRALFTKTVTFTPRYGVSLIGRETFPDHLQEAAFAAAMDTMIYSQKACTASMVHYVEGSEEETRDYARCLVGILREWDTISPQFISPAKRGQIKRMKRGRYARAEWLTNTKDGEDTSTVVIMPDEFDILDHPMCRMVIIRRVDDLQDSFRYLHQGVSTVGVYPETRRLELRDSIAARGVSNVLPLGQCERIFPGAPQDGMIVLSELVDWKNA